MKINFKRLGKGMSAGLLAASFTATLTLSGCGAKKADDAFDGIACGETNQYKSYMNPMDSTLVQTVSIDSHFTSTEVAKIEQAIETWNAQGRRTSGHDLFKVQTLEISATSMPTSEKDCGFPGTSGAFSIMKVSDNQAWTNLGFTTANPGVTIRCRAGKAFAAKQVVLINTGNMTKYPQIFENVVLHELGHAVGLDHSCDNSNSGNPSFAGCSGLANGHDYHQAVMYPVVDPSNTKEDLRSNDEERATCALNYRP